MIRSGQVTVATAGTAVRVTTNDWGCRFYLLRAHPGNTGNVAIGNDGTGDVTVDNGLVLSKDNGPFELFCRLDELWVDAATDGDKLCWLWVGEG